MEGGIGLSLIYSIDSGLSQPLYHRKIVARGARLCQNAWPVFHKLKSVCDQSVLQIKPQMQSNSQIHLHVRKSLLEREDRADSGKP